MIFLEWLENMDKQKGDIQPDSATWETNAINTVSLPGWYFSTLIYLNISIFLMQWGAYSTYTKHTKI